MLIDLLIFVVLGSAVFLVGILSLLTGSFVLGLMVTRCRLRVFTPLPKERAPRSGAVLRMVRDLEAADFRFLVVADENEPGWLNVRSSVFLSGDERVLALLPSHFPVQPPTLHSRTASGEWLTTQAGGWKDLPEDPQTVVLADRTMLQLIAFHEDRLELELAEGELLLWRMDHLLDLLNQRERRLVDRGLEAGFACWTNAERTRWRITLRGAIARVKQAIRSFRSDEHPQAVKYPPRRRDR